MPSEIDRERTGGANPSLSVEERDLVLIVNDVIERQRIEAIKRIPAASAKGEPLIDTEKWTNELALLSQPALFIPFKRGGDLGLASLRLPERERSMKQEPELALADWIDAPTVSAAVEAEAFLFARRIVNNLGDNVRDAMLAGMTAGETIQQIERRVIAVYSSWRESKRAEQIARTETARAFTGGQIEVWKQTGIVTAKKWDAHLDACPFCLEMDGRVTDIESSWFEKGDEFTVPFRDGEITLQFGYADVPGPPLHPNCRCTIIAEGLEI